MARPFLSLIAHATDGTEAMAAGGTLEHGIHLRWAFARELGFPPAGFCLFRRPSPRSPQWICLGLEDLEARSVEPLTRLQKESLEVVIESRGKVESHQFTRPASTGTVRPMLRFLARERTEEANVFLGAGTILLAVTPSYLVRIELLLPSRQPGGLLPPTRHVLMPQRVTVVAGITENGQTLKIASQEFELKPGVLSFVEFRSAGINRIEIIGSSVALVRVCLPAREPCANDDGWQKLACPICLPTDNQSYTCAGLDRQKAKVLALSRLPERERPDFYGEGLSQLLEVTNTVVDTSRGLTMSERLVTGPVTLEVEDCSSSETGLPGTEMSTLDLLLVQSVDPMIARMLGLYSVDPTAEAGRAYDYKIRGSWPAGTLWNLEEALDFEDREADQMLPPAFVQQEVAVAVNRWCRIVEPADNFAGVTLALQPMLESFGWRPFMNADSDDKVCINVSFPNPVGEVQVLLRHTGTAVTVEAFDTSNRPLATETRHRPDALVPISSPDDARLISRIEIRGDIQFLFQVRYHSRRVAPGSHCAFVHAVKLGSPAPLTPPRRVSGEALHGPTRKINDCQPPGEGTLEDTRHLIGIRWQAPDNPEGLLLSKDPILFHIERREAGAPEDAAVSITKDDPILVVPDDPEQPYDPLEGWPAERPCRLDPVPEPGPDGAKYQYRVAGIDIFGRQSRYADWSEPIKVNATVPPPPAMVAAKFDSRPGLPGFDLELVTVADFSETTDTRPGLVVVARKQADDTLHIKVVDHDGHTVLDNAEADFHDKSSEIAALKGMLRPLWEEETISRDQRVAILDAVASITGQIPLPGLLVTWEWLEDQQRQAPSTKEFQVCLHQGWPNVLMGRVVTSPRETSQKGVFTLQFDSDQAIITQALAGLMFTDRGVPYRILSNTLPDVINTSLGVISISPGAIGVRPRTTRTTLTCLAPASGIPELLRGNDIAIALEGSIRARVEFKNPAGGEEVKATIWTTDLSPNSNDRLKNASFTIARHLWRIDHIYAHTMEPDGRTLRVDVRLEAPRRATMAAAMISRRLGASVRFSVVLDLEPTPPFKDFQDAGNWGQSIDYAIPNEGVGTYQVFIRTRLDGESVGRFPEASGQPRSHRVLLDHAVPVDARGCGFAGVSSRNVARAGSVSAPANYVRQDRTIPPVPDPGPGPAADDTKRIYASYPDVSGNSSYAYRWQAVAGMNYTVYRAVDETLFAADRQMRAARSKVRAEWNDFLDQFDEELRDEAFKMFVEADVEPPYDELKNRQLQVLASFPDVAEAFSALHGAAIPDNAPEIKDRVTDPPNDKLRLYVDRTLPGCGKARFFYRVQAVDASNNKGRLSPSTPPIWLRPARPAAPVITRVVAGDRKITLHWATSRDRNVKEYHIYRAKSRQELEDLGPESPYQTLEVDSDPASRPAEMDWPDKPVPGLVDFWYRIVAVNKPAPGEPPGLGSNTSAPSLSVRARAVDRTPPNSPTWIVAERRAAGGVRLAWRTDEMAVICIVNRRLPGGVWKTVSQRVEPSVEPFDFEFVDLDAAPATTFDYRIVVEDPAGNRNRDTEIRTV